MNTVCRRRKPADGFTIVELMVVIAIMAIIAVFAIPSYKGLMTQNRMAGEINDLATDIELARSAAVKQGLWVTICPSATPTNTAAPTCSGSTEWNTGWISFIDTTGSGIYNGANGDSLLRVHGPFTNTDTLVSSSTTVPLTSIVFNRMGGTNSFGSTTDTSDSNTGTLTLHDATNNLTWRRCVVLSEGGNISVYSEQTQPQTQGNCP